MEHSSEDAPLAADSRTGSEEVLVEPTGTGAPGRSNAHALKIAGITTLVCLLVSAQAFTAYMVFNQRQQIQGLQETKEKLRSQMAQPTRVVQRETLSSLSMPVLDFLGDSEKSLNPTTPKVEPKMQQKPEPTPPGVEEELRSLMKDFEFPHFNQSFVENLQALKKQINETSWKSFESWLHYWLLFQMAQKAPTKQPASIVMTKCQTEASNGLRGGMFGSFKPQCDEQGKYRPMQCWHATGYCWCVDESGTRIDGSQIRGRPDCDKVLRFSRTSSDPVMMSGLLDIPENVSEE